MTKQLQNFFDAGYLSYYDIKNFIKNYPSLSDDDKTKHGGEMFYKWANGILNRMRTSVKKRKQLASDNGKKNAFIKPHDKNFSLTSHTEKNIY